MCSKWEMVQKEHTAISIIIITTTGDSEERR